MAKAQSAAGFTLLEILVVLVLVALSAGLVTPAAVRSLEAFRQRGFSADLEALLIGLPMESFQQGVAQHVDAEVLRQRLPDLPTDWRLDVEPALEFGRTGMLQSDGRVFLVSPTGQQHGWRLAALTGAVSRMEARP